MGNARLPLHESCDSVRVQCGGDDRVVGGENDLGSSRLSYFPSDLIVDGVADGNIAQQAALRG